MEKLAGAGRLDEIEALFPDLVDAVDQAIGDLQASIAPSSAL
jgi:hypothetical protein